MELLKVVFKKNDTIHTAYFSKDCKNLLAIFAFFLKRNINSLNKALTR